MIRRALPIITFVLASCMAFAGGQSPSSDLKDFKSTTSRSDLGSYAVSDGSDPQAVRAFIQNKLPNLQGKNTSVLLTFTNTSPGGYHYTFSQTYAGVPVFSSDVVVNVSRKNQVYSIFDDSYDMSAWSVDMTDFSYRDVPSFQSYLQTYFSGEVTQTAKQVVAFDEMKGAPELCYQVNIKSKKGSQRNVLVAKDRVIYEHDANMYALQDSVVTGMVFRPDPLTTAHQVYYGPYMGHDSAYQNYNDSDTYQLNVQRVPVSFTANFDGSVFSLSNQYISLGMLGSNTLAPVTSITPTFNYTRSQTGFLDVMVYYHLNVIRSYVHSLGFTMADSLVIPDSHSMGQDNDFFSPPNNIFYGTGGVPDCQDADVIVHEYTHFLSYNANASNGFGASQQRGSIDEGGADYNATSYSASIDTFKWYNMFSWDGHNEYWTGRYVKDPTVYPNVPTTPGLSGIYKYSVIWSSALMQIWWDIGKGPADSLFFESMYGLASNITLLDAAQQYIKADSLLYNGKYHCTIVHDFHDHGLAVDAACGVFATGVSDVPDKNDFAHFTAYPDGFKVEPAQPNTPIDATVYDIAGQKLATYHNIISEIKPEQLPTGIYVVDVSVSGQHQGYKWALIR